MMTTPFSTICEPGAVVLVNFKFSGQSGSKTRPAVVVTIDDYHNSRLDTVVLGLTANLTKTYFGDCDLQDWQLANLPKPTKARGTIQTVERRIIKRRLGTLSENDYRRVKETLRVMLGLR